MKCLSIQLPFLFREGFEHPGRLIRGNSYLGYDIRFVSESTNINIFPFGSGYSKI